MIYKSKSCDYVDYLTLTSALVDANQVASVDPDLIGQRQNKHCWKLKDVVKKLKKDRTIKQRTFFIDPPISVPKRKPPSSLPRNSIDKG